MAKMPLETTPHNAIEAKSVHIGFNGVSVLHNVDFFLKSGDVHAVVGVNGAGKSTLMKILSGVYRLSSGTIKFFGKLTDLDSPLAAQKAGVAMVYQDLSLIPSLTVAQNVFLLHHPYRIGVIIDSKRTNKRTAELLQEVGVEANISPDDLVENLSPGQRQIVEIVKALASDPKILILDEPTASLSVKEIEGFFEVINRLKERGISIIYITHYLQDVFKICNAITVLRDGKNVISCAVNEINLAELVKHMIGSDSTQAVWKKRAPISPDETPIFEARDITTTHIKNINLKVHKGEIVGIAGLLGSGRTELFDALCGVDRITQGELLIDNVPQKVNSTSKAVKAGISLVPENRRERGLILDFSVQENIILSTLDRFKKRMILSIKEIVSHVMEKIQSLNIKTQDKSQLVRFLSGGNQQKVVVGKCLSAKSRLLLLDDPTFGVDVRSKQEIMSIIRDFVGEENGAVFVSSEFKEIADFCDSVYIMKRGEITEHFSKTLTEEELLYHVQ